MAPVATATTRVMSQFTTGIRTVMWRRRIGRILQFVGLMILPFAIASELVGEVGLGKAMLIAAAGTGVFYVGFLVQHSE
jgi:hypothetical protein